MIAVRRTEELYEGKRVRSWGRLPRHESAEKKDARMIRGEIRGDLGCALARSNSDMLGRCKEHSEISEIESLIFEG
jgi:hypothetical protein